VLGVIVFCTDETIRRSEKVISCSFFITYLDGEYIAEMVMHSFHCFYHEACDLQKISLMFTDFILSNAASYYDSSSAMCFTVRKHYVQSIPCGLDVISFLCSMGKCFFCKSL